MARSSNHLPDIALDAIPRTAPLNMAIQPLQDNQVAEVNHSLISAELPSSTVNMINNTMTNAAAKVTVISNSKNIHMGNNFKSNFFGGNFEKPKKSKSKRNLSPPKPSPEIEVLLNSSQSVTTFHVKDIKLGKHWKRVIRNLHLSDEEIEIKQQEYFMQGGLDEVVYQLLRMWIEKNGSSATLKDLSKALWKEQQNGALATLVEEFEVNAPSSSSKQCP